MGSAALAGGQRAELPTLLLQALFFAFIVAFSFVIKRLRLYMSRPLSAYWHCLARIRVRSMLKTARASVPFEAEYAFDGDSVTYQRVKDGRAHPAWQRRLVGVHMSGPGFTLLYKTAVSQAPYAIFLHQPCAALDAWLERLDVPPLPAVVQKDIPTS